MMIDRERLAIFTKTKMRCALIPIRVISVIRGYLFFRTGRGLR